MSVFTTAAQGIASAGVTSGAGAAAASPLAALGGPVGLGIMGALSLGSMFGSFGLGQSAQSKQWDKWKDSQTRGPLYKLIGLEQAGLNPILAAKGSLGAGGGFAPSAVASGGQGGPNASAVYDAITKRRVGQAQIRAARAQATLAEANAREAQRLNRFFDANPKVYRDLQVRPTLPDNPYGLVANQLLAGENPLFTPTQLREFIRGGAVPGWIYRQVRDGVSSAAEAAVDLVPKPNPKPRNSKGQLRSGRKNTRNRERR